MSSATKPRKSAPLPGCAPWPRISTTGPWWSRSLSGVLVENAAPAVGSVRRLAFDIGADAGRVGGREEVHERPLVVHARIGAAARAGGVDVVPDGDRQEVAVEGDLGAADDLALVEAHDAAEGVRDRVPDGDPHRAAGEQDPVDQRGRVARAATLVDLEPRVRHRGQA